MAKKSGNTTEMSRLQTENQAIRDLYGIGVDTGKLQAFKVGGIVQGAVGEAVPAIVHGGEMVLTAAMQATLWDAVSNPRMVAQSPAAPTYITNNIDMGAENVTLTDKA
ncbi:hypothetical protein, partial [Paenibacillus odorifer]|uniref:hypothetical protein n=1 Tax=Paenibacillus odorifer TaxID=189426 RepID=UPI00117F8651